MLWLAGLMGLMAVGTVTFIDPPLSEEDDDDFAEPSTLSPDVTGAETNLLVPEGNIDPDYDPRGGDDAAILEPLNISDADVVTLTDGSQASEEINGDEGNDRINGFDGDDLLNGGAGNDELRGDEGDDSLVGDAGNDTLHGHDGSDIISGGEQDDVLFGHNEDDTLEGGSGNDALQGSAGNDMLDGGEDDDTLQGGLDDDTLIGGAGADVLFGGWGDDVLSGLMRDAVGGDEDDSDFLNGGGGDDSILVGSGDIVTAGDGADEIVLGDWLADGEAAQIMDYTATDDSLVLVWDDSSISGSEPQIEVSIDADTEDQSLVWMDGTVVATVNGTGILPGDITLIPLSTAIHVGLA